MAPDSPDKVSIYQQIEQAGLSLGGSFNFHCHEGLACFNQCCRTPTIILSPYDILRLKQCLGLTSGEFLRALYPAGNRRVVQSAPGLHRCLPISGEGCPFLGAQGCTVYPHRPAACRLFPITMGSRLTEQGLVDYYFCRKLDYCQGFAADVQWTVESWKTDQGFAEFEQGRREWLEILLKKGLKGPLEADPQVQNLFATIAYDLDGFRRLLSEPAFLQASGLDGNALESCKMDDLALLKFSYSYLQSVLFAESAGLLKIAKAISGKIGAGD